MDKDLKKNIVSGIGIAVACVVVWKVFMFAMYVAYVLMVPLSIVALCYAMGHYAPKDVHDQFQGAVREALDWISFRTPLKWMWVWNSCRSGLDWLGIKVK